MKKFVAVIVILFCANFAFAQDFEIHKLENGQTVIIKPTHTNPIVTVDTWIKTGSVNETDKNSGVAHFLEHLFFKGTKNYALGEFDKILESKGAITNAATGKDFTHYYVSIPSNYFDLALSMHSDMLLNPLIPRKELEKERKVVLEEIAKDLNNPSSIAYNNLITSLYKTHPYKRKVIGAESVIQNITREEIMEFYNKYYIPQNMITVIAGDVDTAKTLEAVKNNFSAVPVKFKSPKYKKERPVFKQIVKTEYFPTQTGYMLIGFHGVTAKNSDTYALDVLAAILGEGKYSVFSKKLKEQERLTFSIYAAHSSFKDDSLFLIGANFSPEKQQKLEDAVFREISAIKTKGIDEQSFDVAKSLIERNTYYSRESVSNIATEIGYTMTLTEDIKYYKDYLKNIQKVTASDVKRVATKYLGKNKSAVSLVLPETLKNVSAEPAAQKSYNAKLVDDNAEFKKYKLENSATVLIAQNPTNDIVAISINALGGKFLQKISGTADLTAAIMVKGTQKYSQTELAKELEENGIKILPSASADSFDISILTTKPQLAKTLELLDEIINHATFDDYEIEKSRANMIKSIIKSRDLPINLAFDKYKGLIFQKSPYSENSEILEKSLPQISREDITDYYSKIFTSENVVISVNGNVNSEELIDKFSQIFENKSGKKFIPKNYSSSIPALTSQKTSVQTVPENKTAWIVLGWQTCGVLNQKEAATLQVINSILGSGMSSRLFKNLRDQEGLAYQVGSGYSPKLLRGAFVTYIGTNPANVAKAKQKMLDEVFRFKSEFVSDTELEQAKEKLLGNYILSLETNLEKAVTTGWYEASGRGANFGETYKTLIKNVSASDIVEVANKYFDENFVSSIVK